MFRETLEKQQPTVYRTLHNALVNKQLSHCYLFTGPKGTLKKETAVFLAQSLICKNSDPFACEQCSSCIRLANDNYVDYIFLDGSNSTIKIEDINNLQSQFTKTALEEAGHKIFIINNCENMTLKAANSLLKFIEEPASDMTGIFISNQPERVLKTIVSRCQNISFKPLSKEAFYNKALELNIDELNSHIIANLVSSTEEIAKMNSSKAYNNAIRAFCDFTDYLFSDYNHAVIYLQNQFAKINKSDKNTVRDSLKLFVEISLIFVSDYLNDYNINDDTYNHLISEAKNSKFDFTSYMRIMMETRDSLDKAANGLLLIDQMLYKLMEVR